MTTARHEEVECGVILDRLFRTTTETAPAGLVLLEDGQAAFEVITAIDQHARTRGGTVFVAGCRPGFVRPLDPFLDLIEDLAAWLQVRQPEILQRFGWSLVNVFYPWRRSENALPVGELRAGLADLVLRNDATLVHQFFQKRNVRPQILSYLVHFVLEATAVVGEVTSSPVVLCFENAHLNDQFTLSALKLLNRYARSRKTLLRVCVLGSPADMPERLTKEGYTQREWDILKVSANADGIDRLRQQLRAEQWEALQYAAILGLPFTVLDWEKLLPERLCHVAMESVLQLVDAGALRRCGDTRYRIAQASLAESLAEGLQAHEKNALHLRALNSPEGEDPFAAAWHVTEARDAEKFVPHCLAAMEKAWAVSAYECAISFAQKALSGPAEDIKFDRNFLMAVLSYEAERYQESEQWFRATLENLSPEKDRWFVEYLRGYNAIFGTGNFKQGIQILERVLKHYEEKGDKRGSLYIRNSMAFAHFRSKETDMAINLEQLNLNEVAKTDVSDSFLVSILQLNLGRIYRNTGEAARALELLRQALSARNRELSAHVLLLFYATLGSFHFSQRHYVEALGAYQHAFELLRDMQLDSVKDQVLAAFSRGVPELRPEQTTRLDELLYYLHFHLGLTFQKLGLHERATVFQARFQRQRELLGPDVSAAIEGAFAASMSAPLVIERASEFEHDVAAAFSEVSGLVRVFRQAEGLPATIAERIMSGQSVAILRPQKIGPGVEIMQSVVLYDPRSKELADKMTSELGGSHIPRATAAIVSPDFGLYFGELLPLPLVYQTATLQRQYRSTLAGLLPLNLCVQVLREEFDDFLFGVVQEFRIRSGIGVLAVTPFHLWRRDLISTAPQAIAAFLVSSVDVLVLGDQIVVKRHGAAAANNLLPFRPRISEEALVFRASDPSPAGDSVLIRIKRRGGYATDDLLKLHSGTRVILDLCDGQRTIAEIIHELRKAQPSIPQLETKVCGFLRDLWRRGAVALDEPAFATHAAA